MAPRKDKAPKGTLASTGTDDQVTGMASLATSHTSQAPDTEDFQAFVRSTLHGIQGQMKELKDEIKTNTADVVQSLEYNSEQTKELNEKVDQQIVTVTELRNELVQALSIIRRQTTQIEDLQAEKNALETYMRKSNVIFEGCPESENEDTTAIIGNLLNNVMNLNVNASQEIDKLHRFGRSAAGRPRPIIVKFVKHSTRDYVLSSAKKLKDYRERIFINEDLPTPVKSRRADLRSIVQHARSEGISAKQTGDRIVVDGHTYSYKTLDCLPAKYALEAARTKSIGEDVTAFYSKHSPFSNFYPCKLTVDNDSFTSVEQAYQATKAKLAGRDDIAMKIMSETDCLSMAKLGESIKLPRDSPWFAQRETIMKKIVLCKFSQNVSLRAKLNATAERKLVETTRDSFWGAGVTINAPTLLNGTWHGRNNLGKILGEVRSQLRNQ